MGITGATLRSLQVAGLNLVIIRSLPLAPAYRSSRFGWMPISHACPNLKHKRGADGNDKVQSPKFKKRKLRGIHDFSNFEPRILLLITARRLRSGFGWIRSLTLPALRCRAVVVDLCEVQRV